MWTFLLDPATQAVAFVGVIGLLGFVAFDLVQEIREPSPTDSFRKPRPRTAAPRYAAPRAAAAGPAMEMWTDAAGETRGRILRGPCAGQRLEDLGAEDCEAQAAYLRAHDPACAATLEAWRRRRFAPPPEREDGDMSRAQALRELGLADGAAPGEIHAAYVRAIKTHHPDHGGSHARAARINRAKEVLT